HANHFIAQKHSSGEYWGGPFPIYHDAFSFLTRFVTHLAAPGFFFLMGMGMLLYSRSRGQLGWNKTKIISHFIVRGLILIALQMLVILRSWQLSPGGWVLEIYIGVLFALGGTMIVGSLALWLPPKYLIGFTMTTLLGVAFLIPDPNQWSGSFSTLERILLIPGGDLALWVNYPVIPWLPLVLFGMLFGHWLHENAAVAYRRAAWMGSAFLLAFLILRIANGFGNIRPRAGDFWIDFLNPVKYPPSLTFILLTLGINLLLLWGFSQSNESVSRYIQPLAAFGQVPLFFYVAHLFLYAGLGIWLTPAGTSLIKMYPFWLLGLLILYPLSLKYRRFKNTLTENSFFQYL
ncbi:MAG: heparan-alpha-glucosaminide N-acetyltransferase domain-containing protein, partial [Chloroflexota bacterium]